MNQQICVSALAFQLYTISPFGFSAIAKVYLEEGNKEYKRKEASNAVSFYTQGIQVNCKDDVVNAKLYSNRATAHFYLGKILLNILHCVQPAKRIKNVKQRGSTSEEARREYT